MAEEDLSAPTGEPPAVPGETIATEMPTRTEEAAPAETTEQETETETAAETTEATGETSEADTTRKDPPLDWRERRRIEETNKRRAAEKRAADAEAELERIKKAQATTTTTEPATTDAAEIQRRAEEKVRRDLDAEARAKAFSEATGRVLQNGLANIPDFESARREMVSNFEDVLSQRTDFFEAIAAVENGHDVFYALAKDPEQAERILGMESVRMGIEISRLSDKLAKPAPEAKPISKVPPPVKPVGGAVTIGTRLDDGDAPMDQWATTYLKQMAGRGR